jgi:hypothetical protein
MSKELEERIMNIFKITTIVFAICFIIALISLTLSYNGNEDENELNQDINSLKISLQETLTKLTEKSEELNMSESFLNSYLNGLGMYYIALDNHSAVNYKFDEALEGYLSGHWSNALSRFWTTNEWCKDTNNNYQEARDIFIEAGEKTTNITYQNICNIYANMMNVSSIAIIYLNEASELYADSCEYYLDGDYDMAHNSKDNAVIKLSYYDEEISNYENYGLELQNILMEIS